MKQIRKEIVALEKKMRKKPAAPTAMELAEKYVEAAEHHQAVAVLMEAVGRFPDHTELHLLCAAFIVSYQAADMDTAEKLIKNVLKKQPENRAAQQLLERIHTCVETMHEVARPFGSDLSDLPTLKSARIRSGNRKHGNPGEERDEENESLPPFHHQLTHGYAALRNNDSHTAMDVFRRILEESPGNPDVREGFRLAYAAMIKERETADRNKKIEVIGRTIQFLEAMKAVAAGRHTTGSEKP